jgi:hypothetical protein
MSSKSMGVVACRSGGFAVFDYSDIENDLPVAAFPTLLEALLFIEKEMTPAEPRNGLKIHHGGKSGGPPL